MTSWQPRTRTNVFVRAAGALLLIAALLGIDGAAGPARADAEVGQRLPQATVHDSLATFARAPVSTIQTRSAVFVAPTASAAIVIVTLCMLFRVSSDAQGMPRALRRHRLRGPPLAG